MEVFRGTPQYEEMAAEEVKDSGATSPSRSSRRRRRSRSGSSSSAPSGAWRRGCLHRSHHHPRPTLRRHQGRRRPPELGETIKNLLINIVAVSAFAYLFSNELKQREKTEFKVAREEELGRLRMAIEESKEDVLVSQLRGNYGLFIIAGRRAHRQCDGPAR